VWLGPQFRRFPPQSLPQTFHIFSLGVVIDHDVGLHLLPALIGAYAHYRLVAACKITSLKAISMLASAPFIVAVRLSLGERCTVSVLIWVGVPAALRARLVVDVIGGPRSWDTLSVQGEPSLTCGWCLLGGSC